MVPSRSSMGCFPIGNIETKAAGVGRRFLIDLEAGKTSCQLGRSLVVAQALGLRPTEGLNGGELSPSATVPDLPDLPDDEEELHG